MNSGNFWKIWGRKPVLEKAPVGNNNIALLLIQNNSNFNNKLKRAYLGRC